MQPLTLSISPGNWRLFNARRSDPGFEKFTEKVLARDDYSCQFCGFQAKQFQEVVNLDGDYLNNRLDNLATACSFCAQCFFLEAIGKSDFGGGILIYLPEMTQGELNALCHVLFTSMVTGNASASEAKNIYRGLKLRAQHVEKQLGEGMSNPAVYGHLLIDAKHENKDAINADLMSKVRVLPNMARFTHQIETWTLDGLKALTFNKKIK